jgi:putative phosphoribosyl transferase
MNGLTGLAWRSPRRTFSDRREAGRVLAEALQVYRGKKDLLVLGLARGGVPVAWEVAAALRAPLDVVVVRKLGAPRWPELALGALASGGVVVWNDDVVRSLRISDEQRGEVIDRETQELTRRETAYREGRPPVDPAGKIVMLVDDGIATGASMFAAIRSVSAAGAAQVVVAVPVAPPSACRQLAEVADDVVCASMPARFQAVGEVYADFSQTSDSQVRELLATPTTDAPTTVAGSGDDRR